jgi:hypothetical protein
VNKPFIKWTSSEHIREVSPPFSLNTGGHTVNSKILIVAAVLVIVAVAGYFYMTPEAEMTPSPTATNQPAKTQ